MFDGYHNMWGMHWVWWIIWISCILFFGLWFRRGLTSRTEQTAPETPLNSLKRRYASGEITTEEFEERRIRLDED